MLDPLAAPRVVTPSGAGDSSVEPSVDERTGGQRLADALVEAVARLLAHGVLPDTGGHRPQLLVTIDHGQLVAGIGAGTLTDGSELSPGGGAAPRL